MYAHNFCSPNFKYEVNPKEQNKTKKKLKKKKKSGTPLRNVADTSQNVEAP